MSSSVPENIPKSAARKRAGTDHSVPAQQGESRPACCSNRIGHWTLSSFRSGRKLCRFSSPGGASRPGGDLSRTTRARAPGPLPSRCRGIRSSRHHPAPRKRPAGVAMIKGIITRSVVRAALGKKVNSGRGDPSEREEAGATELPPVEGSPRLAERTEGGEGPPTRRRSVGCRGGWQDSRPSPGPEIDETSDRSRRRRVHQHIPRENCENCASPQLGHNSHNSAAGRAEGVGPGKGASSSTAIRRGNRRPSRAAAPGPRGAALWKPQGKAPKMTPLGTALVLALVFLLPQGSAACTNGGTCPAEGSGSCGAGCSCGTYDCNIFGCDCQCHVCPECCSCNPGYRLTASWRGSCVAVRELANALGPLFPSPIFTFFAIREQRGWPRWRMWACGG